MKLQNLELKTHGRSLYRDAYFAWMCQLSSREEDVERVNSYLPQPARIRKFVLLHKEFDADEGELTRTRKLRRNLLNERYADMITTMYSGGDSVKVRATVKYRDGRESTSETAIRVATLPSEDELL